MNKVGKIIIGLVAVATVVGGAFFFLNKDGEIAKTVKDVKFGGQEVVLQNGDKRIKLDLPTADQLEDSPVAVMGFVNLTEEQQAQKQEQEERRMTAMENNEEFNEEDVIDDTITGENYDVIKDQSINQISVNLKNGVDARYEISDVVYSKDTLESISAGAKDAKFGDNDFSYTIQKTNDYYFYYMVCNKLETNSIYVVLTSTKKIPEDKLPEYMNAIHFE